MILLDTKNMLSNDDIVEYIYSKKFKKIDDVLWIDMFDMFKNTIFDDATPILLDLASSSIDSTKFEKLLVEEKAYRSKDHVLLRRYISNVDRIINKLKFIKQDYLIFNSSHVKLNYNWECLHSDHGIHYEYLISNGYINSETDKRSFFEKIERTLGCITF